LCVLLDQWLLLLGCVALLLGCLVPVQFARLTAHPSGGSRLKVGMVVITLFLRPKIR
jgi:hypothetical protein